MYQPIILPYFKRQLKQHAKKYRHLKEAVIDTLEHFEKAQHDNIGQNIYKVRVRSKDIPKGKSKSFRLLVLLIETEDYIIPLALYFKGDQENISKKEISDHIEIILFELRMQKLFR